jgi:hypothetical protein
MILAALLIPATTWWASMRYYSSSQETAANAVALKQQIVDQKKVMRKGQEWLRRQAAPDSIEFAPKPMRTTWNGQTDPDRVWQEQRERASELLIRLDASNLETPGHVPANPTLPRRLPAR